MIDTASILRNASPEQLALADQVLRKRRMVEGSMVDRKSSSSGIGSIAGGTLGGALGTLLGPVGTIAGGAIGSGLGEAAEEFLRGGQVDIGNVGRESAFGAAGGVAGKLLGSAGKLLFRGGAKAVPAAMRGAEEAGGDLLKTSNAGKLTRQANEELLKQYGTIPTYVSRETDPLNTVEALSKLGITKPEDAERISRGFTGSEGLVTKAVRGAVGQAGEIDPSGIRRMAQDLLVANEVPLDKSEAYLKALDAKIAKLAGPTGSLGGSNPNDVLEVVRHLDARAAERLGKGGNMRLATEEGRSMAKVDRLLADELEDRLYKQANPHLGSALTPELRDNLLNLRPGNKQWADYVDNLMKSTDVGQLRSSMAPFTRISKIIKAGDLNLATFGGQVPATLEKLTNAPSITAAAATVGKQVAESDAARRAKSAALRFASGATALPGKAAGAVLPQAAGQYGVRAPFDQGSQNDLSRLVPADGSELMDVPPDILEGATGAQNAPQSSLGINFPALVQAALKAPDAKTQKDQLGLIGDLLQIQDALNPKKNEKVASGTQQKMTQAQSGLQAIDQLEQMMSQDPGIRIKGALPGSPGARSYEAAKRQVMDMVARIQTGAALTKEEQAFYERQLPQPFDSPQDVQFKLSQLKQFLTTVASGGGGSEEDNNAAY